MKLSKNPFYFLDVAPTDDRRTILSKTQEKSFFEEPAICEEMQSILLNVIKRASAELTWFPGVSSDKLKEILEGIKCERSIPLSGLFSVAKLNACIHNFSLQTSTDVYEIGYAVLELDELFKTLNDEEIATLINNDRRQADVKEITASEVVIGKEQLREYIKKVILEKTQKFTNDRYAEFATLIAEKCIADAGYDDGIVIDDIISCYELWAQPILEKKEDEIRYIVDRAKKDLAEENFTLHENLRSFYELSLQNDMLERVDVLLQLLQQWDTFAQPLQLRDTARGYANSRSSDLAHDVRELAVVLHNKKGYTNIALKIVNSLKSVFAEMPETIDGIIADQQVLNECNERANKEKSAKKTTGISRRPKAGPKKMRYFYSLIAIVLICLPLFCLSECGGGKNSAKENTSYTTTYNYNYMPTNSYDSDAYLQAAFLKSELQGLKGNIEDMEQELEDLQSKANHYESQYYSTGYDFYADYYEETVKTYNVLHSKYKKAIQEYNSKADEYNRLIGAY